jgi:hypothetical protein
LQDKVRSVVAISKRRDEAVWPGIAPSVRFEVKFVPEEESAKKVETLEVYRVNSDWATVESASNQFYQPQDLRPKKQRPPRPRSYISLATLNVIPFN